MTVSVASAAPLLVTIPEPTRPATVLLYPFNANVVPMLTFITEFGEKALAAPAWKMPAFPAVMRSSKNSKRRRSGIHFSRASSKI